jgi:hypothetical protein
MKTLQPPITCKCPRMGHSIIVNHTLSCLRERRGALTLDQYYGAPAPDKRARTADPAMVSGFSPQRFQERI